MRALSLRVLALALLALAAAAELCTLTTTTAPKAACVKNGRTTLRFTITNNRKKAVPNGAFDVRRRMGLAGCDAGTVGWRDRDVIDCPGPQQAGSTRSVRVRTVQNRSKPHVQLPIHTQQTPAHAARRRFVHLEQAEQGRERAHADGPGSHVDQPRLQASPEAVRVIG